MSAGVLAAVFLLLRHPDAAVVAQRLGHQRQLGLVIAADRDARRMNLRVAGIGEARAALVGAPDGGGVRAARVGREIEHVAVTARREHDGVRVVPRDFAGLKIANDDALGVAVHDHEVEHLGMRVGFHAAAGDHFGRAPNTRRASSCWPVWPRA